MMWFFVSKKRHNAERAIQDARTERAIRAGEGIAQKLSERETLIAEYENRWKSTDGKIVLNDLQSALRLIQEYQRTISIFVAADPHYREADALLERWGMKGDPAKIVGGFTAVPPGEKPTVIEVDEKGKAMGTGPEGYGRGRDVVSGPTEPIVRGYVGTVEEIEARTREDSELFGTQGYGRETALLVTERTEEGDRLYFVPTPRGADETERARDAAPDPDPYEEAEDQDAGLDEAELHWKYDGPKGL